MKVAVEKNMKVTITDCMSPVAALGPIEHMLGLVVSLAKEGGMDFLDPSSELACDAISGDFMKSFTTRLKSEFGEENGLLLHRRYQYGSISPKIRMRIDEIRDEVAANFRKDYLASRKPILDALCDLMKTAFYAGGLKAVDFAIDNLNAQLKLIGSRFLVGPGTACMESEEGKPIWLAVIFSRSDDSDFICLDWCRV